MKLTKVIKIIIIITIITVIRSPITHAQSVSLGLYPPILQVMIQPGKSLTQVYKVNNFGDPVIVSSEVKAFMPEGETGTINLVDCERIEVIGCESLGWFSIQNADLSLGDPFFLGSGRNQEAVLKITVPDYASEGDYYNTLLFTTQAPPQGPEKRSRATATIGSNILITVSKDGNPTREIKIVEFSAKSVGASGLPIFDSFIEIPVTLKVQNTGTAYTSVKGKLALTGFPGLKADYKIPAQNILAGKTRLLSISPNQEFSLTLPPGFYLGRYNLTTEVENEDGTVKKAQTSFFALPIKFIFFITAAFSLLTIILKIRKNRKR